MYNPLSHLTVPAPLTKGGLKRRIESYLKRSNVQLFGVEYDVQLFGDGLVLGTHLFEVRCLTGWYNVQLFGDGLVLAARSFGVRCHDGVEPQGGDRWRLSGFTYSTPAAEELGLFSSAASGISRGDRL